MVTRQGLGLDNRVSEAGHALTTAATGVADAPNVYLAGIVGALQAQLRNRKSQAQSIGEDIKNYLASQDATEALGVSDIGAIRAYLGTPESAKTITNAIVTANRVINHLSSHAPAPTHPPITGTPGRFQSRDTVTVPVSGGEVTIDVNETAAAGIGALVNDEPGLEEDELGNALIGALGSAAVLGESILESAGKEIFIHGVKAVATWFVKNAPPLPGSVPIVGALGGVPISVSVPVQGGNVTLPGDSVGGGGEGRIPDGTVTVIEEN